MSESRSETIVRRMLQTFEHRDWSTLADLFAEDAVFELVYDNRIDLGIPDALTEPVVGRDAIVSLESSAIDPAHGLFSTFRMFDIETHALEGKEAVVAEYKSDAVVRTTGRPYRNIYIGMFKLRDDQITLWREFSNPDYVRDALL